MLLQIRQDRESIPLRGKPCVCLPLIPFYLNAIHNKYNLNRSSQNKISSCNKLLFRSTQQSFNALCEYANIKGVL